MDSSTFPTPAKPVFHSLSQCHNCGISGDDFASPNVEAFEATGEMYCDDCAAEVLAGLAEDEDEDRSDMTARERYGYGRPFNAQREWGTW